jgi:hypothetical protein
LTETLREARRIVDDSARDLSTAEVEARLAADAAGRRISAEALPSIGELEVELWGGRHMPSTPTFASSRTPVSDADDSFETSGAVATPTPTDSGQGEAPSASTIEAPVSHVETEVTQGGVEVSVLVQNSEVAVTGSAVTGSAVSESEASSAVAPSTDTQSSVESQQDIRSSVVLSVPMIESTHLEPSDSSIAIGSDGLAADLVAAELVENSLLEEPAEKLKKQPANVDDLFARLRADRVQHLRLVRSLVPRRAKREAK